MTYARVGSGLQGSSSSSRHSSIGIATAIGVNVLVAVKTVIMVALSVAIVRVVVIGLMKTRIVTRHVITVMVAETSIVIVKLAVPVRIVQQTVGITG